MSAAEVALRFVERINAGDVDGLATLMNGDHRFIDSSGDVLAGRDAMRAGWARYFAMVPDYHIDVEEVFTSGTVVVLLGRASGTLDRNGSLLPEDAWTTPAAFRAHVAGGLVTEWRVYADNEPVRLRMGSRRT